MAEVKVNDYQVDKAVAMLADIPNGAKRALSSALNKAVVGAKTDAVRQITETYTIKATTVRDSISIRKANINSLSAAVRADGAVIPLSKFKVATQKITTNGKSRPILRATVKHGDTKTLKHGFTANLASGHNGVFFRAGKERLPIKQVYSLSIPQMLGNNNVQQYLKDSASERLDVAIEHEIDRLLKGFGT